MDKITLFVQILTLILLTRIIFMKTKFPRLLDDEIETTINNVSSAILYNQELISKIEENIAQCKRFMEENKGDFEVDKRKFVLLLIEFYNAMHHNLTNELNISKMHLIQLKSLKK